MSAPDEEERREPIRTLEKLSKKIALFLTVQAVIFTGLFAFLMLFDVDFGNREEHLLALGAVAVVGGLVLGYIALRLVTLHLNRYDIRLTSPRQESEIRSSARKNLRLF